MDQLPDRGGGQSQRRQHASFAGQEAILEGYTKTYGLRGGNDQLPRAFAATLGTRITYRATVRRIDSRPDEVVVGYQDSNGAEQQIIADFGVCTIPFPVLKKVDLAGLAEQKMKAIGGYARPGACGPNRAEVARFLPGLDTHIVASYVKVWRENPFAGGALAFRPTRPTTLDIPAARRPDNRLHFAANTPRC